MLEKGFYISGYDLQLLKHEFGCILQYREIGTILNSGGNPVNGVTVYNGFGKGYNVYLAKNVFVDKYSLYLTMGHEYTHIAINVGMSQDYYNNKESHAVLDRWEYNQAKAWNVNPDIKTGYELLYDDSFSSLNSVLYKYTISIINRSPILP